MLQHPNKGGQHIATVEGGGHSEVRFEEREVLDGTGAAGGLIAWLEVLLGRRIKCFVVFKFMWFFYMGEREMR